MPVSAKIRRQNKPVAIREKDGMKIWAYNSKGTPICNAKRNGDYWGKRCQSIQVVSPTGRCKKHGGHTRTGITHQSYKTGEFSQYVPASIRERFREFQKDPDYLSLQKNVNLTNARLTQLLEGIDRSIDTITLKRLRSLSTLFKKALNSSDALKELQLLRRYAGQVIEIAEEGKDLNASWDEVYKAQDHLKDLVAQEQKRVNASTKLLTAEEAWLAISKIVWAIRETIEDPVLLGEVSRRIDKAMSESLIPTNFSQGIGVPILPEGNSLYEKFPEYGDEDEEEL